MDRPGTRRGRGTDATIGQPALSAQNQISVLSRPPMAVGVPSAARSTRPLPDSASDDASLSSADIVFTDDEDDAPPPAGALGGGTGQKAVVMKLHEDSSVESFVTVSESYSAVFEMEVDGGTASAALGKFTAPRASLPAPAAAQTPPSRGAPALTPVQKSLTSRPPPAARAIQSTSSSQSYSSDGISTADISYSTGGVDSDTAADPHQGPTTGSAHPKQAIQTDQAAVTAALDELYDALPCVQQRASSSDDSSSTSSRSCSHHSSSSSSRRRSSADAQTHSRQYSRQPSSSHQGVSTSTSRPSIHSTSSSGSGGRVGSYQPADRHLAAEAADAAAATDALFSTLQAVTLKVASSSDSDSGSAVTEAVPSQQASEQLLSTEQNMSWRASSFGHMRGTSGGVTSDDPWQQYEEQQQQPAAATRAVRSTHSQRVSSAGYNRRSSSAHVSSGPPTAAASKLPSVDMDALLKDQQRQLQQRLQAKGWHSTGRQQQQQQQQQHRSVALQVGSCSERGTQVLFDDATGQLLEDPMSFLAQQRGLAGTTTVQLSCRQLLQQQLARLRGCPLETAAALDRLGLKSGQQGLSGLGTATAAAGLLHPPAGAEVAAVLGSTRTAAMPGSSMAGTWGMISASLQQLRANLLLDQLDSLLQKTTAAMAGSCDKAADTGATAGTPACAAAAEVAAVPGGTGSVTTTSSGSSGHAHPAEQPQGLLNTHNNSNNQHAGADITTVADPPCKQGSEVPEQQFFTVSLGPADDDGGHPVSNQQQPKAHPSNSRPAAAEDDWFCIPAPPAAAVAPQSSNTTGVKNNSTPLVVSTTSTTVPPPSAAPAADDGEWFCIPAAPAATDIAVAAHSGSTSTAAGQQGSAPSRETPTPPSAAGAAVDAAADAGEWFVIGEQLSTSTTQEATANSQQQQLLQTGASASSSAAGATSATAEKIGVQDATPAQDGWSSLPGPSAAPSSSQLTAAAVHDASRGQSNPPVQPAATASASGGLLAAPVRHSQLGQTAAAGAADSLQLTGMQLAAAATAEAFPAAPHTTSAAAALELAHRTATAPAAAGPWAGATVYVTYIAGPSAAAAAQQHCSISHGCPHCARCAACGTAPGSANTPAVCSTAASQPPAVPAQTGCASTKQQQQTAAAHASPQPQPSTSAVQASSAAPYSRYSPADTLQQYAKYLEGYTSCGQSPPGMSAATANLLTSALQQLPASRGGVSAGLSYAALRLPSCAHGVSNSRLAQQQLLYIRDSLVARPALY